MRLSKIANFLEDNRLTLLLSSIILSSIMSTSILSVITPELASNFEFHLNDFQIRNVLFFSIFAGFLLVSGRIADSYQTKKVLLFACGLFLISCIGSTFAIINKSWVFFLCFQSMQALSDAFFVPVILKLIRSNTPKEKLGTSMGIFVSALTVGGILGPIIGGFLADFNFWKYCFVILFIFCFMGSFFSQKYLKSDLMLEKKPIFINLISSFFLVFGIILIQFYSKTNSKLFLLGSILSFLILIIVELTLNKSQKLISTKLFSYREFSNASLQAFFLGIFSNFTILVLPGYLREIYGIEPLYISLGLTLESVVVFFMGTYAGKLGDTKQNLTFTIGYTLLVASTFIFLLPLSHFSGMSTLIFYLILGLSTAFLSPVLNKMALGSIPEQNSGEAAGVFHFVKFLSGAFASGLIIKIFELLSEIKSISNLFITTLTLVVVCIILYCIGLIKEEQSICSDL